MAVKTPEEKALGDVEKAIKDYEKAVDKREAIEAKADEARAAEHRALRTLEWTARHPDLADDFDLAAFQQSLQAPFDDEDDVEDLSPEDEAAIVEAVAEAEAEESKAAKEAELDAADEDDDDPFGDA